MKKKDILILTKFIWVVLAVAVLVGLLSGHWSIWKYALPSGLVITVWLALMYKMFPLPPEE